AAALVDLFDGQGRAAQMLAFGQRAKPAARKQHTYTPALRGGGNMAHADGPECQIPGLCMHQCVKTMPERERQHRRASRSEMAARLWGQYRRNVLFARGDGYAKGRDDHHRGFDNRPGRKLNFPATDAGPQAVVLEIRPSPMPCHATPAMRASRVPGHG